LRDHFVKQLAGKVRALRVERRWAVGDPGQDFEHLVQPQPQFLKKFGGNLQSA
jgi:hypothetical protein